MVSAPSGSGKTTLCRMLLQRLPGLVRSVSATTRSPRRGEKNRRDYFFMDAREFRARQRRGVFLEWARVFGSYYGTPKPFVTAALKRGKDVLLSVDVQGARQVKRRYPDAVLIFILPPSMKVLARRLRKRATERADSIQRRLRDARRELAEVGRYDYALVNRKLERSFSQLKSILVAERNRVG